MGWKISSVETTTSSSRSLTSVIPTKVSPWEFGVGGLVASVATGIAPQSTSITVAATMARNIVAPP